jgi:pyrroloquinoline-quinone synthase
METRVVNSDLLCRLDELISRYHLLKHPFYQAWTKGELSRECLQTYAAQYYRHVEAFPRHLRALAERCDGSLRNLVEENLAEEENPAMPHPQLWRDFAEGIGVREEYFRAEPAVPGVKALVDTFDHIVRRSSLAEAVAAFYAYESQVPEISTQKISGLMQHYGVTAPRPLAYFRVHEEADVRHRQAWRAWLAEQSDVDEEQVLATAESALRALWGALDAVYTSRN